MLKILWINSNIYCKKDLWIIPWQIKCLNSWCVLIHLNTIIIDYLFSIGIFSFFLPAYSTFFNSIEFVFSFIKSYCKRIYSGEVKNSEEFILTKILQDLHLENMAKIFEYCGYSRNRIFDPSKNFPQNENTYKNIFNKN